MRFLPYATLAVVVAAVPAAAQTSRDCRYEAERAVNLDAGGIQLLDLDAGSGSLKVVGKPGLTSIRLHGRACASDKDLLDEIKLDAHRSGSSVVAKANVQEHSFHMSWHDQYARLDLVVEVPAGLAAKIDDGSGEMNLSDLGATDVEDGSGSIEANDIAAIKIHDGSGSIDLRSIGSVDIDDGSGDIDIRGVRNNVRISDGSGSITVRDVGGDFVVTNDGSGGIDYDGVRGKVEVPERHRRHR